MDIDAGSEREELRLCQECFNNKMESKLPTAESIARDYVSSNDPNISTYQFWLVVNAIKEAMQITRDVTIEFVAEESRTESHPDYSGEGNDSYSVDTDHLRSLKQSPELQIK